MWTTLAGAAEVAPSSGATVTAAGITALAGLVGAVIGGVLTNRFTSDRERRARTVESQRRALHEVQDAALALRMALMAYDPVTATPAATRAVDEAQSRLTVVRVRVHDRSVRSTVGTWMPLAELYFTGDPTVSITQENGAWLALQTQVGKTLDELD